MVNLVQFRPFIVPVVAFTKDRVKAITKPRPECGIRWGKASRFEYEKFEPEEEKDNVPTPSPIAWPDRMFTFEGDEVWREFSMVLWNVTEAERIKSIIFFTGITEHKTEEQFEDAIQPITERRYNYLQFTFTDEGGGSSGERGEFPDDPPLPTPTWAEVFEMIHRGINNRPWLKGG